MTRRSCFGAMVSKGLVQDCDICADRMGYLEETSRKLKETEKISDQERKEWREWQTKDNLKTCSLGAQGECE